MSLDVSAIFPLFLLLVAVAPVSGSYLTLASCQQACFLSSNSSAYTGYGGSCRPTNETGSTTTFLCQCYPGYFGPNCTEWDQSFLYGYSQKFAPVEVVVDSLRGLIHVAGTGFGVGASGDTEFLVFCLNATTGQLRYTAHFGSQAEDVAKAMALDLPSGNVYITGYTFGYLSGETPRTGTSVMYMGYNGSTGQQLFIRTIGGVDGAANNGALDELSTSLALDFDQDNNYAFIGGSFIGACIIWLVQMFANADSYVTAIYQFEGPIRTPGSINAVVLDSGHNYIYFVGKRNPLLSANGPYQIGIRICICKLDAYSLKPQYLTLTPAVDSFDLALNEGAGFGYVSGSNATGGFLLSFSLNTGVINYVTKLNVVGSAVTVLSGSIGIILTNNDLTPALKNRPGSSVLYFALATGVILSQTTFNYTVLGANFNQVGNTTYIAALSASGDADVIVLRQSSCQCGAGQACVFSGSGRSLSCGCQLGFSGDTCLIDVCNPNPCLNGGVCTRQTTFSCECIGNSFGPRCDKDFAKFGEENLANYTQALAIALDTTRNVGYIVGGTITQVTSSSQTNLGALDVFVACVNLTSFEVIFARMFGTTSNDAGTAVVIDAARGRGFIEVATRGQFSSSSNRTNSFVEDIALIAFDLETGAAIQARQYVASLFNTSSVQLGVAYQLSAAGMAYNPATQILYLCGSVHTTPNSYFAYDMFWMAVDASASANLSSIYSKQLGGSSFDFATAIVIDGSANVGYISGWTNGAFTSSSINTGSTDTILVAFRLSTGEVIYSSQFQGSAQIGADQGNAIVLDGAYLYIGGQFTSSNIRFASIFQVQASTGSMVSKQTYGSAGGSILGIAADPSSHSLGFCGTILTEQESSSFSASALLNELNQTMYESIATLNTGYAVAMDPLRGLTFIVGTTASGAGFLLAQSTYECSPGGCSNGGYCNTTIATGPRCVCVTGTTGHFCEVNLDDCVSSPCLNNGTCMDGLNTYWCSCSADYTGYDCSIVDNACYSSPCTNGGSCNRSADSFHCTCPLGRTGVLCQSEIDYCRSTPCQHGGRCMSVSANESVVCQCALPFFGNLCENADYCLSSPCMNNGTCFSLSHGFNCSCPGNFTGRDCNGPDDAIFGPSSSGAAVAAGVGAGVGVCVLLLILLLLLLLVRRKRRQLKSVASSASYTTNGSASPLDVTLPNDNEHVIMAGFHSTDFRGSNKFGLQGTELFTDASQTVVDRNALAAMNNIARREMLFVDSSQVVKDRSALARLNEAEVAETPLYLLEGETSLDDSEATPYHLQTTKRVHRPLSVIHDLGTSPLQVTNDVAVAAPKVHSEDYQYYAQQEISDQTLLEQFTLDRRLLRQVEKIGQGNFGEVWLMKNTATKAYVAAKSLHNSHDQKEVRDFYSEAKLLSCFDHENVVRLLGVCFEKQPALIVLEYIPFGDVRNVLRACSVNPQVLIWYAEQCYIGMQIAQGMAYLARIGFVHRDLALRNCLLGYNTTVKIADFGLSRDMSQSKDEYYVPQTKGVAMPIRWMAIESLEFRKFSSKSDVWSFGVVMWEIMTMGCARPYGAAENRYLPTLLRNGHRLPKPDLCPDNMHQLMLRCWAASSKARPTFAELQHMIFEFQTTALNAGETIRALGETLEADKKVVAEENASMI